MYCYFKSKIGLKDLFIAPSFDELEEVAKNKAGDLKKLNDKQLATIWNRGSVFTRCKKN